MNIYYLLQAISQCCLLDLSAQIAPVAPLTPPSMYGFLLVGFLTSPYFLALQDAPGSSSVFSALILESAVSSSSTRAIKKRERILQQFIDLT